MALRVKINPERVPNRDQPLSIHKLSIKRGGISVLREVSFELSNGEILGIYGKNGSGKSTLVNTIAGTIDVSPTAIDYSHVLHDGQEFLDLKPHQIYTRGMHCVFQGARLFQDLTVKENLEVAMPLNARKKTATRITEVVDIVPKMNDILDTKAKDCTMAQQQIVAISRAIMLFPSVLILDEPTYGLDPEGINAVSEMINVLITSSIGILVLDSRDSFVNDLSDRSLLLENGRLVEPSKVATRASEWKPQ